MSRWLRPAPTPEFLSVVEDAIQETTFTFDQGSYADFELISEGVYRITPVHHRDDLWNFWSLKSNQFSGETPNFLIAKANKTLSFANERLACWATALDTDTWTDFATQSVGATDITIQHNAAFPGGVVYIAKQPLYPFSRTERLIREWAANALVGETSSTTNLILGHATARSANDGTGRIAPALPFYGFKISSGGGNTKNKCILSSGNHPNEIPGRFALEGAMAWLLGGSTEASFLLDWFDFYVYPCLNPQGIWAGYWSCNPQIASQHNDTTAGFEDLDAFTAAMDTDTGGAADVGIDFHGYNGNITAVGVVYDDAEALHVVFRDAYKVFDNTFALEADTTAVLLTKWQETNLSTVLSVNLENGMNLSRSIANYKTSGENTVKALTAMQAQGRFTNGPGVGSRDFSGSMDRIDWASVFNTAGSALTISVWMNVDALPANPLSAYALCTHRSGDAAYGTVFGITWEGRLTFFRNGTTGLAHYSGATAVSTGTMKHYLVTHDGVMTTASSIHFEVNGVQDDVSTYDQNGTGEYAATGKWSVGGRYYDDARNVNGKIAQMAVWNRVLNSTEKSMLAAGYAPDLAAPSGLQFYWKGNTSSLTASPGGDGTADGTTQLTGVGNGPAIIYG